MRSLRLLRFARGLCSPAPRGKAYGDLSVGVAREAFASERRVALTPSGVSALRKAGIGRVRVESYAGAAAQFDDAAYEAAGAVIVTRDDALAADVVLAVRPPAIADVAKISPGAAWYGYIQPAQNPGLVDALVERKVAVLAMDQIPRTLSTSPPPCRARSLRRIF